MPSYPSLHHQQYAHDGIQNLDSFVLSTSPRAMSPPSPALEDTPPISTISKVLPPNTGVLIATLPEQKHEAIKGKHSAFIEDSFPLSTEDHSKLRSTLAVIMSSPWKLQNTFEPRQSTLLDFLGYETMTKRWTCRFWSKGCPCSCSFTKKDQAKNHIRFHIEHLPFSCDRRGIW